MTIDYAQRIKSQSFELHNAIENVLTTAAASEDDHTFVVSGEELRLWKKRAKSINVALTRLVRSVHDCRIRHMTEMNVLREVVRLDIIDREASYSQTLAVLRDSECDTQLGVERALRAVSKQSSLLAAVEEKDEVVSFRNIKICGAAEELKEGEMLLVADQSIQVPNRTPRLPEQPPEAEVSGAPVPHAAVPIEEEQEPDPSALPPLQPQPMAAKHAAMQHRGDSSEEDDD
ncbi:hypothetical protein N9S30_00540 [bacterium]|nr:hypothetical protein [bacterium]MDA9603622.1 hypothetical protein [bacterium]